MKELDTIDFSAAQPNTVTSLASDMEALGLRAGMILLVHSSMSALGWVCGGAQAVILALEKVISPAGTLVMPAHSYLSDPAEWRDPPVPEAWWPLIREQLPVFDPDLTPTRGMGMIPETFRKQQGVLRSYHPSNSFAAWGKLCREITENHNLAFSMNETSPLGRIYQLNGYVLLMGVSHDKNTSLHLAEYRSEYNSKKNVKCYAPLMVSGYRKWVEYADINFNGENFLKIGSTFEAEGMCSIGKIGSARAVLFRQRDLVDFAVSWMEKNR